MTGSVVGGGTGQHIVIARALAGTVIASRP
jgi:hypothetical protein